MNYSTMSFDEFIKFDKAVKSLEPAAKYSANKTNNTLTWISGTQPSDSEIDAEITRLQAEFDNAQYARDRATAYPPMADQLDDIFHNGVAGWKKTIQAVKDTYPKP